MPPPVYVTASFAVKPDALDEVRIILAELTDRTREEPGCLDYGYYQSLADPFQFFSFEVWQNAEEEASHWQTEHLQRALERAAPLLQDTPRITRSTRIT